MGMGGRSPPSGLDNDERLVVGSNFQDIIKGNHAVSFVLLVLAVGFRGLPNDEHATFGGIELKPLSRRMLGNARASREIMDSAVFLAELNANELSGLKQSGELFSGNVFHDSHPFIWYIPLMVLK